MTTHAEVRELVDAIRGELADAKASSPQHAMLLDEQVWQEFFDESRKAVVGLDELAVAWGILGAARLMALTVDKLFDLEDVEMTPEQRDIMADSFVPVLAFAEMSAAIILLFGVAMAERDTSSELDELLELDVIDPDCKADKHRACVGGPCTCDCHKGGE